MAMVPVCSTVSEVKPSIPTQKAAYVVAEEQVTLGWTHEPSTLSIEPEEPVTA